MVSRLAVGVRVAVIAAGSIRESAVTPQRRSPAPELVRGFSSAVVAAICQGLCPTSLRSVSGTGASATRRLTAATTAAWPGAEPALRTRSQRVPPLGQIRQKVSHLRDQRNWRRVWPKVFSDV